YSILLSNLFSFFNHTPTPEIYTLSLHDALPISAAAVRYQSNNTVTAYRGAQLQDSWQVIAPLRLTYGFDWQKVWADRLSYNANGDRKSTRLNSSHVEISYAVFCLKKKKKTEYTY